MKIWSGILLLLLSSTAWAKESLPEQLFSRTASGLVACYENVGVLLPSYDEEGRCNTSSGLSAWTMTAKGPVETELEKFEALGWVPIGSYKGKVIFRDPREALCFFNLSFVYSGEDITVSVSRFTCVG